MEYRIKDISVHYEVRGEGKPVVMLHGYPLDHRLMTGCMEPIFSSGSGYQRIYIDLPGMGRSDCADWITDADVMLEILIGLLEEAIPDKSFLLAGESYGGYLARGILYRIPDRVDGLLLICPVMIADNKKRTVPRHTVIFEDRELMSKLPAEDARDFASSAVIQSAAIYQRYREEVVPGIKLADAAFVKRYQETGYEFSFDVDRTDRKFDRPTLILTGRQDSCVGYQDAWGILKNFPRATFAVLDSAGHLLQTEQEDLFRSLVSEWLSRTRR